MADDQAAKTAIADDWDYKPAKKSDDDEWDYKPAAAPAKRTWLQGLNDWYTRETNIPNDPYAVGKGVLPAGGTQRESPRSAVQNTALMSVVPLLGPAIAAPVATGIGLAGGYGGGKLGGYLGEKVGAPELGEDIGGTIGGIVGGVTGERLTNPRVANYIASKTRLPATARQSQLGRPGPLTPAARTVARVAGAAAGHTLGLPGAGELGGMIAGPAAAEAILPKGELGTPTNPGPFMDIPARAPKVAIPKPAVAAPFPGATPTAIGTPLGSESLPAVNELKGQPSMFPRVMSRAELAPNKGISILPEPREAMPGDRPGAMWSVGREDVLPEAAQRGMPGAGDVLRNIGKPIIYTPREGVGYPGPRGAGISEAPPVKSGEPLPIGRRGYKPSEKVETMSEKPRDLGQEFTKEEWQHEITRSKSILRNPLATAEEKSIARDRLRDAEAGAAKLRE